MMNYIKKNIGRTGFLITIYGLYLFFWGISEWGGLVAIISGAGLLVLYYQVWRYGIPGEEFDDRSKRVLSVSYSISSVLIAIAIGYYLVMRHNDLFAATVSITGALGVLFSYILYSKVALRR